MESALVEVMRAAEELMGLIEADDWQWKLVGAAVEGLGAEGAGKQWEPIKLMRDN